MGLPKLYIFIGITNYKLIMHLECYKIIIVFGNILNLKNMLIFFRLFWLSHFLVDRRRRRRRRSYILLNFEARTSASTMIQDPEEQDYTGGRGWVWQVGGFCSESNGEDHVSVHIFPRFFEWNHTFSSTMLKTQKVVCIYICT